MAKYDNKFKVVLVGDGYAGKTSLVDRYINGHFSDLFIATLLFNNGFKAVKIKESITALNIWEVAGSFDRLNSARASVYGTADGVIIVYDVTSRASFSWVPHMINEVNVCTKGPVVPKLLIGNKTDLVSKRVIDCEEAQELANRLGMTYIETSAKDDTNVTEAFRILVEELLESETLRRKKSQPCCMML